MNMNLRRLIIFILAVTIANIAHAQCTINILDAGGKNNGKIDNTEIIAKAIQKITSQGGGTLYFPAGEYLTGPIHFESNLVINIDAGATLLFSNDFDQYLPFVQTRWEGVSMKSFSPLFYAFEKTNITITGRGKIDGQGQKWWSELYKIGAEVRNKTKTIDENKYRQLWTKENPDVKVDPYYQGSINLKFFRPPFIQPYRCSNVLIEGITIVNSPFWTINPEFCDNVTVRSVTINNPPSPNTDGINPESCKNVHISDCHISVGDDCITIKSGRDADGRKLNIPCENITITNCTMLSGHGGVVIGSEMSGGVEKSGYLKLYF
jgi:polygalacturonase